MTGESVRQAAHLVGLIARHDGVDDVVGRAVAVFTSWGFGGFALLLVAAVVGRHGSAARVVITALLGGASAFLAAGLGLVVKRAVAEPRPCQRDPGLAEAVRCPAPGDWSFPSNHAVIAGALAVTLVVVARTVLRLWIASIAILLAVAIGASRVVLGVHHWWDVVAGLGLGAAVAAVVLLGAAARVDPCLELRSGRGSSRAAPVG